MSFEAEIKDLEWHIEMEQDILLRQQEDLKVFSSEAVKCLLAPERLEKRAELAKSMIASYEKSIKEKEEKLRLYQQFNKEEAA